jgi:hypothetical protein
MMFQKLSSKFMANPLNMVMENAYSLGQKKR